MYNLDLVSFQEDWESVNKDASLLNKDYLNRYWRYACDYGNIELLQYLIKENLENHCSLDDGLLKACIENRLDIIQYLLTSSDIKKHPNIMSLSNTDYGSTFLYTYFNKAGDTKIIDFVLYELLLPVPQELKNYIQLKKYADLIIMIEHQETILKRKKNFEQLDESLFSKCSQQNKQKI